MWRPILFAGYTIVIRIYGIMIWIFAIANPKAKLWIEGRKNWRSDLRQIMDGASETIWIHVASLGEFEQGKPLIDELRLKYPERFILLTFFSPSGFEIRRNYKQVDHVGYLPLDTPKNAKEFIEIVSPSLAIFIKYEFWFNYISTLKSRNIPTLLVSAVFNKQQFFFKAWAKPFLILLRSYRQIFVQDAQSFEVLQSKAFHNISKGGDTRIDRVREIASSEHEDVVLAAFCRRKVLMFGSIWQQDEKVFLPFIRQQNGGFQFVIAPHEVDRHTQDRYLSIFEGRIIEYSKFDRYDSEQHDILLIDKIGLLSRLYKYADIVYIGGAFGHGLHNILEPAAYLKPILFGTNYKKFVEAKELVSLGAAFSVKDSGEFEETVNWCLEPEHTLSVSIKLRDYLDANAGATFKVVSFIENEKL